MFISNNWLSSTRIWSQKGLWKDFDESQIMPYVHIKYVQSQSTE